MAILSFEEGMATCVWRRSVALRIRVNISAMGSDILMMACSVPSTSLPTGLHDAGHLALERQLPETNPAEPELAHVAARPAAAEAAVAHTRRVLAPRFT